jgi:hypothetical protein
MYSLGVYYLKIAFKNVEKSVFQITGQKGAFLKKVIIVVYESSRHCTTTTF